MNAKERVNVAMNGGIPDRVPVIPQICHPHALRMLGKDFRKGIIQVLREPMLMNRLTYECAMQYGVDGMRAWMAADPVDIVEEGESAFQIDKDGHRIGKVDFQGGGWVVPFEEIIQINTKEDVEKLKVTPANELLKAPQMTSVKEIVEKAGNNLFIISSPGAFTVEYIAEVRGKAQACMDIIDDADFAFCMMEKALEIAVQKAIALCRAGVDGLMIADVYGGVISPKQFGKFCVPYFKKFIEKIKPFGKKIYLHICGNSTGIFEMMAETGVDCIEPLDPLGGVVVADAKKRVGSKTALMGGVDTRILAHGTLDELANDVKRCLTEGSPGGGYILAAGDMLPTETAPEKVLKMLELTKTVGKH